MHVVHLGFVVFEPFDVHRGGVAGVDSDHGPLRVLADVVPVILELGVVGAYLLLAIGGHPAVCGHPQLGVLLFVFAV